VKLRSQKYSSTIIPDKRISTKFLGFLFDGKDSVIYEQEERKILIFD